MRSDNFLTHIGDRSERGCSRLWLEDSFGRLSRNGFDAGAGFAVTPRPGVGLVFTPSVLGSCHVSHRRSRAILSYEAPDIERLIPSVEARVRLSVKTIIVMPSLRVFAILRKTAARWTICGNEIVTQNQALPLTGVKPLHLAKAPAVIEADLTEANLVYATEVIGNARPGVVVLSGEPLAVQLAGQFLLAAGYEREDQATTFRLRSPSGRTTSTPLLA